MMVIVLMILSMVGPAIVLVSVGTATIQSLGRNPSAAPQITFAMIVSLIFVQSISVVTLLVVFQIYSP